MCVHLNGFVRCHRIRVCDTVLADCTIYSVWAVMSSTWANVSYELVHLNVSKKYIF